MKIAVTLRSVLVVLALTFTCPLATQAFNETPGIETEEQHIARLNKRLEEIHDMDKTSMTRSEKKALRVEVKKIKKEMAEVSGGLYISAGALLLIALLLIILL
jgi:hypothetical protein